MALLAILIVLLAFVPEYAGQRQMKPPSSWPVIIHAAIMSAWVVLFFVQAYLGATGRIGQHRRVGNFGFALGWLVLLSMMFVQFRGLATHPLPEDKRIYDWLLPFLYVYFSFSIFLVWAYRNRLQPACVEEQRIRSPSRFDRAMMGSNQTDEKDRSGRLVGYAEVIDAVP
jgi:hypothetical protein